MADMLIGDKQNRATTEPTALIIDEKPICSHAIYRAIQSICPSIDTHIERSIKSATFLESDSKYKIVIIDLHTINRDIDTLSRLVVHLHPSPVVAIDDRPDAATSRTVSSINCRAYIAKTFDEELIAGVIRSVIAGRTWFQISDGLHVGAPCDCSTQPNVALTERQNTVLACLARGLTNEDIARQLQISIGTTKTHVHTVLTRLGARNRTEAAMLAAAILPKNGSDHHN